MSTAIASRPTEYIVNCPDCGTRMRLKPSQFKNGYWYSCPRFPECRGSHGAHPNGKPLGVPANQETKEWRIKTHQLFDPIYECYPTGRERRKARWRLYQWLAYTMQLDISQAHIGRFTVEQCQQLIGFIQAVNYTVAPYPDESPLTVSERRIFNGSADEPAPK